MWSLNHAWMTKSPPFPRELSTYDFLKTLAVILMIADHIGYYFYPDEMWFRVFGRLSVPIWFFLIGYARTAEISKGLILGALIIVLSALITGQYLLPLNILFSIIAARLLRNDIITRALQSAEGLRGMFLILVCLTWPTMILLEYGSLVMLFVIFGAMIRQAKSLKIKAFYRPVFAAAAFLAFFIIESIQFPRINLFQTWTLLIGLGAMATLLWNFKPATYPVLTRTLPAFITKVIKIFGRCTLEIYVIHLVFLRFIALYLVPDRFHVWDWKWVPAYLIAPFQ